MALKAYAQEMKYNIRTLTSMVFRGIYHAAVKSKTDQETISRFHQLYYDSMIFKDTWGKTTWLGTPILKCPLDLWIYQEIFHELKPDLIIECGTAAGGSAMYMASLCDLINKGRILSVDIEKRERPAHPRVTYLAGSSISDESFAKVKAAVQPSDKVLVILDSDHSRDHVLKEMNLYSPLVSIGSYMIVEDSNINGHPVYPQFGPGPMEAIQEFLKTDDNFAVDKRREKLMLTFNPSGFLKRMK